MSIDRLDPYNLSDVNGITNIHQSFLSDSPVVKMGEAFMRKFYYRKLVEDGLIDCSLCREDQKVVGFISYTRYPLDFMTRGLQKRLLYLSWLMVASVAARPKMIRDIFEVFGMMRERQEESAKVTSESVGEVLSLAVLPEYTNFVPAGGNSRLSVRLFESMVEFFRAQKFQQVYLYVQPKNVASNLFCQSMGCEFEKINHRGLVTHRYTYQLNGHPGRN